MLVDQLRCGMLHTHMGSENDDNGDKNAVPFVYDYGSPWCVDRLGHPHFQDDGCPSPDHHRTECRSHDGFFDSWFRDGQGGPDGLPGVLSVYLMRPFRFGQAVPPVGEDRLVLEFVPSDGDGQYRCLVPASAIRHLAAHLAQMADVADGGKPPRHLRVILTG